MNEPLKITLPPTANGQDVWGLYFGGGMNPVYTPRRWYHRAIYRVLMYLHDRAESVWHKLYYAAQSFAPERKFEYVEPKLYGFIGKDGVVRNSNALNAEEFQG